MKGRKSNINGARQKESGGSRISLVCGRTKTQLLPEREPKRDVILLLPYCSPITNRVEQVTKLWKKVVTTVKGRLQNFNIM